MINEKEMTISVVWGIEDVRTCIEDNDILFKGEEGLTDQECFEVLKLLANGHDANEGITWGTIEWGIEYLYSDRIED